MHLWGSSRYVYPQAVNDTVQDAEVQRFGNVLGLNADLDEKIMTSSEPLQTTIAAPEWRFTRWKNHIIYKRIFGEIPGEPPVVDLHELYWQVPGITGDR